MRTGDANSITIYPENISPGCGSALPAFGIVLSMATRTAKPNRKEKKMKTLVAAALIALMVSWVAVSGFSALKSARQAVELNAVRTAAAQLAQ